MPVARFNTLLTPGGVQTLPQLPWEFLLTDVVLDLWSFPDGWDDSKASAGIWLVNSQAGWAEILLDAHVDRRGRQYHFATGIACPAGTELVVTGGVFVTGGTADLRVLLLGSHA